MINEELKVRFLAGECTEEELIALRDILKNSPEEKQELFLTKSTYKKCLREE